MTINAGKTHVTPTLRGFILSAHYSRGLRLGLHHAAALRLFSALSDALNTVGITATFQRSNVGEPPRSAVAVVSKTQTGSNP